MQTEKAKELIDQQLEQLSEALASGKSEQLTQFLSTMAKFHKYSLGNALLIMCQKPEATRVAGFHKWKELGRTVKKGEKGIAILAPMHLKRRDEGEANEPGADGDEKDAERHIRFRVVFVFDVNQTEGEELPDFAKPSGEPGNFLDKLRNVVTDMDISLEYKPDLGGALGQSSGGLIAIKSGLTPAEEFATLAHELAHECLHKGDKREGTTVKSRELEAEAVAFVVSQSVGLDVEASSSDYIQLYQGTKDSLVASLEAIRAAAGTILTALFEDKSDRPAKVAKVPEPTAPAQSFSPQPKLDFGF